MMLSDLLAKLDIDAILAIATLTALAMPLLGRVLAPFHPRAGEVLIRLGADLQGLVQAVRLPRGTPSVSALPVDTASVSVPPPPSQGDQ